MCYTCFLPHPAFDSTIPASVLFFHPKARELVCFFSSSCRRASQPLIVAIVVRSRAMYGGRFGGSVLFRRIVCGMCIDSMTSALPPRLDAVACSLCYARPAVFQASQRCVTFPYCDGCYVRTVRAPRVPEYQCFLLPKAPHQFSPLFRFFLICIYTFACR